MAGQSHTKPSITGQQETKSEAGDQSQQIHVTVAPGARPLMHSQATGFQRQLNQPQGSHSPSSNRHPAGIFLKYHSFLKGEEMLVAPKEITL